VQAEPRLAALVETGIQSPKSVVSRAACSPTQRCGQERRRPVSSNGPLFRRGDVVWGVTGKIAAEYRAYVRRRRSIVLTYRYQRRSGWFRAVWYWPTWQGVIIELLQNINTTGSDLIAVDPVAFMSAGRLRGPTRWPTARRFHDGPGETALTSLCESKGKMERWYKTLKGDCIRVKTPLSLDDARRLVTEFVAHHNEVRLHGAIGYIAPADKLAGREKAIHAKRDRKLNEARERRRAAREASRRPTSPAKALPTLSGGATMNGGLGGG
jgi:hypothetical protein